MGYLRPYVKTAKQKQAADKSFLGRNREGKREVEKCCVTMPLWSILLNTLIPSTTVYRWLTLLVTGGTARRNFGRPGLFLLVVQKNLYLKQEEKKRKTRGREGSGDIALRDEAPAWNPLVRRGFGDVAQ